MNQQSFASYIGLSPATLSGILQERTRPTLPTVEFILKKFPNINLTWLITGQGEMYLSDSDGSDVLHSQDSEESFSGSSVTPPAQGVLNFSYDEQSVPSSPQRIISSSRQPAGMSQRTKQEDVSMKIFDKPSRKITEIRVFYDDQTWESFVPKR